MIEIQHSQPEPPALRRFRDRTPNESWKNLPHPIKEDIHNLLDIEQENLCVYCETRIDRNSCHLEHLQPQSIYPNLRFRYGNLAQSCNSNEHCGHKKGGREIPVLPRLGCNKLFFLSGTDGKLGPNENLTPKQKDDISKTIEVLNLNNSGIARQRQQYVAIVVALGVNAASFLHDQPFRHILQTIL